MEEEELGVFMQNILQSNTVVFLPALGVYLASASLWLDFVVGLLGLVLVILYESRTSPYRYLDSILNRIVFSFLVVTSATAVEFLSRSPAIDGEMVYIILWVAFCIMVLSVMQLNGRSKSARGNAK